MTIVVGLQLELLEFPNLNGMWLVEGLTQQLNANEKVRDLGDLNGLIGRLPSEVANIIKITSPPKEDG